MNKLKELEILNLWNSSKVSLEFKPDVTLLTGINGSGKSTILNIIFDSLTSHNEVTRNTSKNRFWSTKSTFENDIEYYSAIFPNVSQNQKVEQGLINLLPNANYHNLKNVKEFEKICCNDKEIAARKNITYSDDSKRSRVASVHSVFLKGKEISGDFEVIDKLVPDCFLYQEDRSSLHKKQENLEPYVSSFNYHNYKNSIDDRLIYIRSSLQNYESQITKKASEFIKNSDDAHKIVRLMKDSTAGIDSVFELLNKYFLQTNKRITKDEENMITAQNIDTKEVIPWYLLSRGEKTIIYLFLVALIYKDSIFLLDEPEISLHVKWQKSLVSDLMSIAPKSQFIIATHSPDLIGGRWLPNCLKINHS